jgi:hypothetical protein
MYVSVDLNNYQTMEDEIWYGATVDMYLGHLF